MYEKVNPHHPDKLCDRIGGRLVDLAYTRAAGGWAVSNPTIAGEITIGHGAAFVTIEGNADITEADVRQAVEDIAHISPDRCTVILTPQDPHLADNQAATLRCGDNGIFRGCPVTEEQRLLTALAKTITEAFPSDGKYVICDRVVQYTDDKGEWQCLECENQKDFFICQSQVEEPEIMDLLTQFLTHNGYTVNKKYSFYKDGQGVNIEALNPLGYWTGGPDVDAGAVNRKLGSDMGAAMTGGGLHFKDLSKADVSVNIVCHMLAQKHRLPVEACCAIGDEQVTFRLDTAACSDPQPPNLGGLMTLPFADIVEQARLYVLTDCGGFEHLAEWGLVRPSA